MNKKEFYKRFLYLPIPRQYLDKIWQWIEQYGKKQRIDENERLIKIIKECGTWSQTSMGFTVNDFESRIKELKANLLDAEVKADNGEQDDNCCQCSDDEFIEGVRYCGNCNKRIKYD